MKSSTAQYRHISRTKIALIDNLEGLKAVNNLLDNTKDTKNTAKLINLRNTHIRSINKLIPFLNSAGKLNDKEITTLLSLDLLTLRKAKFKYRIGKNSSTGLVM